jgi:hypothetical protein
MTGRCLPAIILFLAAAATPGLAETYKWVDAKGVVNYSNKPPPQAAAKPQVVEDRVSVVAADPSTGPAVAAMQARAARRAQYEEADFRQRQDIMLAMQPGYSGAGCSGSDCGTGYGRTAYFPYAYSSLVYGASAAWRFAPVVAPLRTSFPSGGRGGRGFSR